jgi:hypothetical protein
MTTEQRNLGWQFKKMKLDELVPNEKNPRRISEAALTKLTSSIEQFGFAAPIIAQKGTNLVLAGHQRLKAAKQAGLDTAPVLLVDMEDSEALAYTLADNRLAEESEWDTPQLQAILAELQAADLDELVALSGFEERELDRIFAAAEAERVSGALDAEGGETAPIIAEGDYYQLVYAVTSDQRETVLTALRRAREEFEVATSADALVRICHEYMGE